MNNSTNLAVKMKKDPKRAMQLFKETKVVSGDYPVSHLDALEVIRITFPNVNEELSSRILVFYGENKIQVFNENYADLAERLSRVYESSTGEKFEVDRRY